MTRGKVEALPTLAGNALAGKMAGILHAFSADGWTELNHNLLSEDRCVLKD